MSTHPKPTAPRRCTGPFAPTIWRPVNQLLGAGADAKAANRYGVTPLYLACQNANPAMIERLLKAGADPNATTTEGETALMTVARTGVVEAAKVLLDHGAKVDAREEWHGQTALMWAVNEQHPAMVKELIAHGADVNAVSNVNQWERQKTAEPRDKWLPLGGLTPLLFAARQGCVECAQVLLDAGAKIDTTDPGRHQPGADGDHQRALRRRRFPAQPGRGSESGRRHRPDGSVFGGRLQHHAGFQPPVAQGDRQSDDQPGPDQAAPGQGRERQRATAEAAAVSHQARSRRRHHAHHRHHAAAPRRQSRRPAGHAPAAGQGRRSEARHARRESLR